MPPRRTQLSLSNLQDECRLPTRKLATCLPAVLDHLPPSARPLPFEVEINWISAAEMCRVHAEFLQDPSLTDVITFDHGEVLVCPLVARDEAGRHGHTFLEELLFYAIHGLLHLLGWRDDTPIQREAMHAEQSRILGQVLAMTGRSSRAAAPSPKPKKPCL